MFTTSIHEIFDARLAPYEEMPLADELALIADAQAGVEVAKLRLLRQYAGGLRAAAAREYARAGGRSGEFSAGADPEEVRANVLVAFMEALAACDGTTRVAVHLRAATLNAANEYHLRSSFAVPARTRSRYFQALREAAPGQDPEDKAVELGMSRETFREVRAAFATASFEGLTVGPMTHTHTDAGQRYGAEGSLVMTSVGSSSAPTYATTEDRVTLARAYAAVDELTLGIIEDAYGFAYYDDESTPDAPQRERDPFAGFDPIADAQIAHLRGLSRSGVQRKRTDGIAAMRTAVGA